MSRMDSRRARRMMKQMGMNMKELGDIKRVILQSDQHEIVIEGSQVTSIIVQGTKMYQITGGRETVGKSNIVTIIEKKSTEIQEEDILLVAQQAGVSIDVAKKALEDNDGDLAQAIVKLQTR